MRWLISTSVVLAFLWAAPAYAADVTLHGPQQYIRGRGAPVAVKSTFPGVDGKARLVIDCGSDAKLRPTSAIVSVNGAVVFGPDDFKKAVVCLEKEVAVGKQNALSVELRGEPGSRFTVRVVETLAVDAGAVIGPAGGLLAVSERTSPAFGVRIEVPAHALDSAVVLMVSKRGAATSPQGIFNVEPSGLAFRTPIRITLPWQPERCDARRFQDSLAVLTRAAPGQRWSPIPFTDLNVSGRTLTCLSEHLSDFTVHGDRFLHETSDEPDRLRSAPAVVLVHGVQLAADEEDDPRGSSTETFGTLKDLLRAEGYDVWSFEYATAQWIEYSAGNFGLGLKDVRAQKAGAGYSSDRRISVVAHSMGGLVCRSYMQDLAAEADDSFFGWVAWWNSKPVVYTHEVDRLIMLGTPNYGSPFAFVNALPPDVITLLRELLSAGEIDPQVLLDLTLYVIKGDFQWASIEMIPGSDFLDTLNERDPFFDLPTDAQYHCVYGTRAPWFDGLRSDGLVVETSARLRDWEDDPGYDVTAYPVEAAHSRFLWFTGIAYIDGRGHPCWPIIRDALGDHDDPNRVEVLTANGWHLLGSDREATSTYGTSSDFGGSYKITISGSPDVLDLYQDTTQALYPGDQLKIRLAHSNIGSSGFGHGFSHTEIRFGTSAFEPGFVIYNNENSRGEEPVNGTYEVSWTVDRYVPAGTRILWLSLVWPGTASYWFVDATK